MIVELNIIFFNQQKTLTTYKLAAAIAMTASYHPYTEILTSHPPDSPSFDNFSSLLVGYRNGLSSKEVCENNSDLSTQRLSFMDDTSNDYHNQQILNSNTLYKVCGGCGEKISDRYLLYALDRYWHNSCLKCHCCGATLGDVGSSCFTRRGLILCKKDYSSMFGCSGICSGCGETIPPSEMVARSIPGINNLDVQKSQKQFPNCVFHLKCFTCAKCGANLRPGDRYTMLGASLVCEQDWQKLIKNSPTTNGSLPTRKGKVGRPRRSKDFHFAVENVVPKFEHYAATMKILNAETDSNISSDMVDSRMDIFCDFWSEFCLFSANKSSLSEDSSESDVEIFCRKSYSSLCSLYSERLPLSTMKQRNIKELVDKNHIPKKLY